VLTAGRWLSGFKPFYSLDQIDRVGLQSGTLLIFLMNNLDMFRHGANSDGLLAAFAARQRNPPTCDPQG